MTAAPPGEQVVVHLEGGSPFGLRLDGGGNDRPIYVSKVGYVVGRGQMFRTV